MILSKTKLALYSRLGSRKQRQKLGLFVAEGNKCVSDTIGFFSPEAIIMLDSTKQYVWLESMPVYIVTEDEMRKVSQLQTLPDIVAIYRIPEAEKPDEKLLTTSLTLLLDGVQDPGNLGTIIRTASWFGIKQVILGNGCADPYNQKTVQSSMGAIGMVRIIQQDLSEVIISHPEIPVYGTLLDGDDIYTAPLSIPGFVAMGNEGNGLSDDMRRRVTFPLLIPSFANGPHAESLNVAAATAITLSEFSRRRL